MSVIALLSDIHGNRIALDRVLDDMKNFHIDEIVLLGDLIDYGMQSNEVVDHFIRENSYPVRVNLWGNHERAIATGDFSGFSSARGEECAKYTAGQLNESVKEYVNNEMEHAGWSEFEMDSCLCLAIHGSKNDPYWKSITPSDLRGDYSGYDYVFSGHSHIPHWFTVFYDSDNREYRNKKATVFINPGAVGQPRNHTPLAQYMILDMSTGEVMIRRVPYDTEKAMALYSGKPVHPFYRDRLKNGV